MTCPGNQSASEAIRRAAGARWAIRFAIVLLAASAAHATTLRLFVLTGQSNSLGTPTTNTEAVMVLPKIGAHPSEQLTNVPFFYDNTAGSTAALDAALGDSGGGWTNICLQKGGYYAYSADHWGPEVGFARLLWDARYRDFGIVKASCGGGGNSYWDKTNSNHYMYDQVVNTVSNAVRNLPPGYTASQTVCLLYVQGESNNTNEASQADIRFSTLLANLQNDLPSAAGMKGVFGQIASDASGSRLTTTQKQSALAAARPDIGFAKSAGLTVHNVDGLSLHYNADSLIILGERMAAEAMRLGALPEQPLPAQASLAAWFRGDHGVVPSASATVSRWDDLARSVTNRDLTQIVGAPALTSGAFLGATRRNFVRFDGIGQSTWGTAANFGFLTAARTLVFAARVVGGGDGFLFDGSTGTGMSRAQVRTNTWQVGVQPGPASLGPNPDTPTTPRTTGVWQFHEFSFTPTNSGTRIKHWLDGTNVADFLDPETNGLGGFIVAANVQAQRFLGVDVGEILIYSGELSASARSNVLAYLRSNWASDEILTNAPTNLPPFVPVFQGGIDGYTCFRIPALVTTTSGTVIAMSDGRIGGCGDIPTPLDLVIKRSFDNGRTWGPLQVVTDYGTVAGDVDTYPYYGQTNISRVSSGDAALLVDRANGRIWTLYDNGGVVSGSRKIKLEMKYSDDDGATWSPRLDIEALNPGLRPTAPEFLAGPGNGIQLAEGPYAGRLLFCAYAYGNPYYSTVIYSDDHGATWQRGGNAGTGGGEIQVAETSGGGLIASMRDNAFSWSGVRTFSRSTDGGATWSPVFTDTVNPPAIPDPGCQGNIYRLTTTSDSSTNRLLQANAASFSSRVNLTLRISYDDGATWPVSNQVYAAGSAYSSVTRLATGDVGLLFEKDPYGDLSYTWRSVSQMTGGADSLPAYDLWKAGQFSPPQLMNPAISGPNADPDHDGLSNYQEFIAGTNPLDAASALKLKVVPAGTNGPLLQFNAVSNKTYSIQSRADLSSGPWTRFSGVDASPSNALLQISVPPTNAMSFFRIATPQTP